MLDPKIRANIHVDMEVIISRTGVSTDENTYRGKVVDIVDSEEYNSSGILVKIHSGRIGHVVTILDEIEGSGVTLEKKIMGEEGQNIELKSSLYYDHKLSTQNNPIKNEELVISVAEEVASIMNSNEGASLFIGVEEIEDGPNIIHGIQYDTQFMRIGQSDSDKFKLELKSQLEKYLKNKAFLDFLEIKIHDYGNVQICELIIMPSPIPMFVHVSKQIKIMKKDLLTKQITQVDNTLIEYRCYVRVDAEKIFYTPPDFLDYWIRNKQNN